MLLTLSPEGRELAVAMFQERALRGVGPGRSSRTRGERWDLRVATGTLRLICNLKSGWIFSIMIRLPTNKFLSGDK